MIFINKRDPEMTFLHELVSPGRHYYYGNAMIPDLLFPFTNVERKFADFKILLMAESRRSRTNRLFQAGRHIVMGIILMALGYAVVHFHRFGTIELTSGTSYTLAAIMVVYGLFRIWRGTRELRGDKTDDFIS